MTLNDIRVNNCFVGANKEDLTKLVDKWSSIDNSELLSVTVTDYKPVASSSDYAIFTTEESSLANLFNIKKDDVEDKLKKLDVARKVVAITNANWQKEKEKYKDKIKHKEKYVHIDEPTIDNGGSKIKEQMQDLFTDEIIEIS
jgi:hypothetical protein